MRNLLRTLGLGLLLLVTTTSYGCDEAYLDFNTGTDNADGTYTYTFDLCIEMLGLEGIPDWFEINLHMMDEGDNEKILSHTNPSILTSDYDVYMAQYRNDSTSVRWELQSIFAAHNTSTLCTYNLSFTTKGEARSVEVKFHDTYPSGSCTDWYDLSITHTALPVKLVSFTSEKNGGVNLIKWSTASEKNSDYFQVFYSDEGNTNWKRLGDKVSGQGTTQSYNEYKIVDNTHSDGIRYYKLQQVDYDGNFEEYGPISIVREFKEKRLLHIYNMNGQEVSKYYKGVKILIYDDGTMIKQINVN